MKRSNRSQLCEPYHVADTVSFLVPLDQAGEALRLLLSAKSEPLVRWVSTETRAALTPRQKALCIKLMNSQEGRSWGKDYLAPRAGILVIFDDKQDAVLFKLAMGGYQVT